MNDTIFFLVCQWIHLQIFKRLVSYEWNIWFFCCVGLKNDQIIWIFRLTSNWPFSKRQTEVNNKPKVTWNPTELSYFHGFVSISLFAFMYLDFFSNFTFSFKAWFFFSLNLVFIKYFVNNKIDIIEGKVYFVPISCKSLTSTSKPVATCIQISHNDICQRSYWDFAGLLRIYLISACN